MKIILEKLLAPEAVVLLIAITISAVRWFRTRTSAHLWAAAGFVLLFAAEFMHPLADRAGSAHSGIDIEAHNAAITPFVLGGVALRVLGVAGLTAAMGSPQSKPMLRTALAVSFGSVAAAVSIAIAYYAILHLS